MPNQDLQQLKNLLQSHDPTNTELALCMLLGWDSDVDTELARLISDRPAALVRCLQLQCRQIYPYIHTADIQATSALDSIFWAELAQLHNLHALHISNAIALPSLDFVGTFQHLQELFIKNAPLTKFPDAWANLTNLATLRIINTQLTRLPNWIVQLQQLTKLELTDNQLQELPFEVGFLENLRVLNLSHNQIHRLPSTIQQLTQLKYLYISNNNFTKPEISRLHTLLPNIVII